MKTCTRCGVEKSLDEFHKCSKAKNGRQSMCKPCKTIDRRERYVADPEKGAAVAREWRHRNPEASRATSRKWRENNPEQVKASRKKNYDKNRDARIAYSKQYYWDNLEARKSYAKMRWQRDFEKLSASYKSRYWEGREHLKEESRTVRPHVGYRWYWPDGSVAYVGITQRSVEERTKQHIYSSDWYREDLIAPTVHEIEFDNFEEGQAWEREQVLAAVERGDYILNTVFNPLA